MKKIFFAIILVFVSSILFSADPKSYYEYGIKLLEKGDFKKAISYIGYAAKIEPKNADYFLALGKCYDAAGDPATAAKYFKYAENLKSTTIVKDIGKEYLTLIGTYGFSAAHGGIGGSTEVQFRNFSLLGGYGFYPVQSVKEGGMGIGLRYYTHATESSPFFSVAYGPLDIMPTSDGKTDVLVYGPSAGAGFRWMIGDRHWWINFTFGIGIGLGYTEHYKIVFDSEPGETSTRSGGGMVPEPIIFIGTAYPIF